MEKKGGQVPFLATFSGNCPIHPEPLQAIGWVQTTYAIRFNRRHRRTGHLVQGRFKAHEVEADAHGSGVLRVVQRLEANAHHHAYLAANLKSDRKQVGLS